MRRLGRLGLRRRVTVAFASGALLVAAVLSAVTYELSRTYLLRQRESSATRQAFVNAGFVRDRLQQGQMDVAPILESLGTTEDSRSFVRVRGQWYATTVADAADVLPENVRAVVADGSAVSRMYETAAGPRFTIGVPIRAVDAHYFEVFSLDELERTLRILTSSLVAAAAVAVLAGAALGHRVSGRVLQPLDDVATAAAEISAGRLDTRLPTAEGELGVVATSFNAMVAALQQRIARDARFASDVSHELRSPLTTLSTSLSVLEARRDELTQPSRQALDLLRAEVGRFQTLVADLLEISRHDAELDDSVLSLISLDELVLHSIPRERLPDIALDLSAGPDRALVMGDKRRLQRVVRNLTDNADRHGGGTVRVGVVRDGDEVRLEVDDAGAGVAAAERDRIFERFARGLHARSGDDGGTGLGLSLVAEHARVHHGRVWIEDRPGGGARFIFALPAARE
ncbi:MAG: HAMP domain-containing sensor histidine kinase [Mycobacteriales bacterium]